MRFRLLVSSIVVLQALLIHAFVARGFPLSADDYSYLYQARLFVDGRFYAEDPLYDHRHPLHHCIETNCLRDEAGRRFSKYAPGWPAVLSVGVWLHVPWLVQPLLAGLLTFLTLGYVERRMGPGLVKIAALLLTACVFYAYYGASLRPHLAVAVCVFGAFLAFESARERPREGVWWIAIAGLLLGASALMRYVDWVPLGLWIAVNLVRSNRRSQLLVFATSFGILAVGNLTWNWILSGHPLVAPTYLGADIRHHDRLTLSWGAVPITAARLTALCLVFPPVLVIARYWSRGRAAGLDQAPLALFFANAAIYFLFSAAVGGPGPRYYFAYFPFLVIATVAVYTRFIDDGSPKARRWWRITLAAQVVVSALFIARETYTLHGRSDVERTLAQMPGDRRDPRIVQLITGTYRTDARDLTMNPPDLESAATLYLSNCRPDDVEKLGERFTDRQWFTYSFPGQLIPLP